jgi:RNA recognition motif-containing protein
MNIFVGNLNALVTSSHLSDLFVRFGKVSSVEIIRDAFTGRSLGFGYIEMDTTAGEMAIQQLDCINFMNRYMEVNEANAWPTL